MLPLLTAGLSLSTGRSKPQARRPRSSRPVWLRAGNCLEKGRLAGRLPAQVRLKTGRHPPHTLEFSRTVADRSMQDIIPSHWKVIWLSPVKILLRRASLMREPPK